jgi:undecaprenyl-diphosphatase
MFTNSFDSGILSFFSDLNSHLGLLNRLASFVSENGLIKGGFAATLIWWLWFQDIPTIQSVREKLLGMIVATIGAIFIARGLALLLPFRIRPLANSELGISFPLKHEVLESWSSFPSDHAVLFFTLATGIWLISRPVGLIAFFHAIFVVCLPRIYLGLHYPTDIIAGASLGIGIALLANRIDWRRMVAQPLMKYVEKSPSWFYLGFFILTFQIGEMFESTRNILRGIFKLLVLIKPL